MRAMLKRVTLRVIEKRKKKKLILWAREGRRFMSHRDAIFENDFTLNVSD